MEADITDGRRSVELISAKINDIYDDDIRTDYRQDFDRVEKMYIYLKTLYEKEGFTETSSDVLLTYKQLLNNFSQEFEL